MFKQVTTTLAAIAMFTATGSCIPTTMQAQTPPGSSQNGLSSSDMEFATEAAQGGMAEVQLGQLASQRAASTQVKRYGQRMVQDHTKANNQLKQLAQRKGITLPNDIGDENRQMKANLSQLSGKDFDQAYIKAMLDDHTKDLSAFQREAQEGQDPDLKAWAAKTASVVQDHLQRVRAIAAKTAGTTTNQ